MKLMSAIKLKNISAYNGDLDTHKMQAI